MSVSISNPPGSGDFSIGGRVWPGLSKLIEEAAEVLQVAGKLQGSRGDVARFDGTNLKERLECELGDLLAAVEFVQRHNPLGRAAIERQRDAKLALFETWHRDQQVPVDAVAGCFPPGVLAEVAAVLRHGAAKTGAPSPAETGGGQTIVDHLRHAYGHVAAAGFAANTGLPPAIDHETGRSDISHAIARLALARGLELAGSDSHFMR